MSLLPDSANQYDTPIIEYPSDTWIFSDGKVISFGSGQEAMRQAIDIILNVERFRYQIYTPNFGAELNNLIGKEPEYVESMLRRRINEAFSVDKRILGIENFSLTGAGIGVMACSFDVITVFGTIRKELQVD